MLKRIGILLLYCLPAAVAAGYSVWANYDRAVGVATKLEHLLQQFDSQDDLLKQLEKGGNGNEVAGALRAYLSVHEKLEEKPIVESAAEGSAGPESAAAETAAEESAAAKPADAAGGPAAAEGEPLPKRDLITFFRHLILQDRPAETFVQRRVEEIWWDQTLFITTWTLLPFLLLGSALAFDRHGEISARRPSGLTLVDKGKFARERWALKFLFSFILMTGWTYVVNPIGRGATLTYTFAQTSNLLSANTLPLFIDSQNLISPTACGFLGWYLHMLGYFFKKLYQHDTASSRVYGLLIRKFLFVWGIALMIAVVPSGQAKILAFLIGFFPLSAFKTLKDFGVKTIEKSKGQQEATLMDLPCISRWQALRLEEEGVEDIPTLASSEPWRLRRCLPIKNEVVDMWIDAARLISIVGGERYQKLETICQTATHFEVQSADPDFRKRIYDECQIGNPDEVVSLLRSTFSPISQEGTQTMHRIE